MTRMPWDITREMFLSVEEVRHLLSGLRTNAANAGGREGTTAFLDRLMIEALLFSGLRNSEFCALSVADTIIGTHQSVFVVRARGESGRTVYIPEHVSELVQTYVDEIRPSLLPDDVRPMDMSDRLIYHERRRPYERTGLYRRIVRILTEAGLGSRASVQLLRHTYGYLAYLLTGGNLLFVQRQLGHAHPMVTSIYAKFVNESYAEMAGQVSMLDVVQATIPSAIDD